MEKENDRYTSKYKAEIVIKFLKSGKTIYEFANDNCIRPRTLFYWRKQFEENAHTVFEIHSAHIMHRTRRDGIPAYAEIIRSLREESNLTQNKVAVYLGTSQAMYKRYEQGTCQLPVKHLVKLAEMYNVHTDYILGLSGEHNPLQQSKEEINV